MLMIIVTFIFFKGMYGGVLLGVVGVMPNDCYVFSVWDINKIDCIIYEGVMKSFCCGCHMTSTKVLFDFDDLVEFSGDYACNVSYVMSYAQHVLRCFWNSGAWVYFFECYDLVVLGDCSF